MGAASRTTHNKRQKERARQEKQREKAERRQQRNQEKAGGEGRPSGPPIEEGNEMLLPEEYHRPETP